MRRRRLDLNKLMNMRKFWILTAAAALVFTSCEKVASDDLNTAAKQYFDSWIQLFHPDAVITDNGSYVLEETKGTGASMADIEGQPYVRVDYIARTLDGKIQDYTGEKIAQQLGEFYETDYFGPTIWYRGENNLPKGVDDALASMNIGGTKTVAIPGWLLTTVQKKKKTIRYEKLEDYFKKESGTPMMYTLCPVEAISNIDKWEIDSLCSWITNNQTRITPKDSLKWGFYYVSNFKPSEEEFPADTTFKINYTGRLLNGTVFDTTIEKVAKQAGIWKSGKTYGPVSVKMAEEYSDIELGGGKVVDGFAYIISQMHQSESGTGIFYSKWGYGASGSGNTIPPYSPLIFDIFIEQE